MIRIRNPHGDEGEWKGDWADDVMVRELPQDVRDEYNMVDEDDGEFYMSVEDFSTRVYDLTICHVMNDHVANEELGFEFDDSVSKTRTFLRS